MSRRLLLLVFALAVPAMLLATLPLGLALDMTGAGHRGLSARSASGSVWNGRLEGASLRGVNIRLDTPNGAQGKTADAARRLPGPAPAPAAPNGQAETCPTQ